MNRLILNELMNYRLVNFLLINFLLTSKAWNQALLEVTNNPIFYAFG